MPQISVKIDAHGNPVSEAHGYEGTECDVATKPIEDVLAGNGSFDKEYKNEWEQEARLMLDG